MANNNLPFEPITDLAAQLQDGLDRFFEDVVQNAPPEMRDILFESKQSTLGRAMLADVVDVIPVVGDVSNFFRVRHAGQVGQVRTKRVPRQSLDLLLGSAPEPVGAILDILTPTNTLTFLREGGFIR